jgi:hypothetical protein
MVQVRKKRKRHHGNGNQKDFEWENLEHYQEVTTGRNGGEKLFLTKLVHVHQAEKAFKVMKPKTVKEFKDKIKAITIRSHKFWKGKAIDKLNLIIRRPLHSKENVNWLLPYPGVILLGPPMRERRIVVNIGN